MVIVAEGIEGGAYEVANKIREGTSLGPRVTILGYIQRGGSPTARDRIVATYMGHEAVKLLTEGKSSRVIAIQGENVVDYDIEEALKMTKGLDQYGLGVMERMTGI